MKRLLILSIILFLTSCVRYIDSRNKLVDEYGFDPSAQKVGIEGFYRYEQEQRKRLELLIQERELDAMNSTNTQYRLGPGDEIQLYVKNFDEVSKKYKIDTNGSVRLPFVGVVELDELTIDEAVGFVKKLVTDYVVDPQVDLEIVKYSSNVVWVVNAEDRGNNNTEEKNSFPIKSKDYSLVNLLTELSSSNYLHSSVLYLYPVKTIKEDVSVVDRFNQFNTEDWSDGENLETQDCTGEEYEDGKQRVKACYPYENKITSDQVYNKYESGAKIEIDVEELFGGATKSPLNVILKPGDLIYIPQPPLVQVYGEVKRQGSFQAANGGMNGGGGANVKPTLFSALTASKGLTYSADIEGLQIYREIQFGNKAVLTVNLEKVVLLAGQDIKLRDGDIIYVPSKSGRFYQEHTINAINRLTGAVLNVDDAGNVGQ